MEFAEENQGKNVRLLAEDDTDGKRLLGQNRLIAFEGDCSGEIVNGVKIVIGGEGANPDNVFHFIQSPKSITITENENGIVTQIILESLAGIKSTLEIVPEKRF